MGLKLIGLAVGLYSAYLSGVFMVQRQVLFPANHLPRPAAAPRIPVPHETMWLELPFGRVEAWYLKPAADNAANGSLAILAHGNGDLIDTCLPEAMGFIRMGMRVLMVEYPGYGRSTGKPSEETVTATFIAVYDEIAARTGIEPARIVLYGRSLGGGAVCRLAANRPTGAMILVSTFTGVDTFARRFFAPGSLVRDRFDNLSVVRAYAGPVLLFHGDRDEIIPYSQGVALAGAAANARLVTYGCGHNNMPPDATAFWNEIGRFLRENGMISDENARFM